MYARIFVRQANQVYYFSSDLESKAHSTENVGPSHSDEPHHSDEDSAPDQDDTELLRPTSTPSDDFGLRLRQTSRETE